MRTTSLHMIANINANDCQQKYQQLLLTVFNHCPHVNKYFLKETIEHVFILTEHLTNSQQLSTTLTN